MKTQIIQLSEKEDTISIKDKMSWCHTGRILLVLPEQGQVLHHQLDLTLVKRYAQNLGAQLAFVTKDPDVRNIASQLSIPVFDSSRIAQERVWSSNKLPDKGRRADFIHPNLEQLRAFIPSPDPVSNHPVKKILCLGISFLAVITLAIFILPGAKVTLTPGKTLQSVTIDLNADPSATSVVFSSGSLPVYTREVYIEGSAVMSTTGYTAIPYESSQGKLLFTNESHQEVILPPGILISTVGNHLVRFKTSTQENILLKPGKSVELTAKAVNPGSAGNLPPGSLVAIEDDLGLVITVTNPDATTGGADAYIKSPREQDLQVLRSRLANDLINQATIKLQSTLPDQDILILPTMKISELSRETTSPEIGEPGEQVELFERVKVQAQVVSGDTLRSFIGPILDASIPEGYSASQNSLQIIPVSEQKKGVDGKTHWTIKATRWLFHHIASSQVTETIRGEPVNLAEEKLLAGSSWIDKADIELTPTWWPRLPLLAMRISVFFAGTQ